MFHFSNGLNDSVFPLEDFIAIATECSTSTFPNLRKVYKQTPQINTELLASTSSATLMKSRTVTIPKYLYEIHGRTQTALSLAATYIVGILTTVLVLFSTKQESFSLTQYALLVALTLDIASGVVANSTQGTSDYYAENVLRRWIFLALHVTQPLLLIWLFPSDFLDITIIAALTLASGSIVNMLQTEAEQRVTAMSLLVLVLGCATLICSFSHKISLLLMLLYSTKIILAFAVRWNTHAPSNQAPNTQAPSNQ